PSALGHVDRHRNGPRRNLRNRVRSSSVTFSAHRTWQDASTAPTRSPHRRIQFGSDLVTHRFTAQRWARVTVAAGTAAALLVLSACGSDDDGGTNSDTGSTAASTTADEG